MAPLRDGETVNANRALPVKLDVTDCDGRPVPGLAPGAAVVRANGAPSGVRTTLGTDGDGRYEGTLKLKDVPAGAWLVSVTDPALPSRSVRITVR